MPRHRAATAWPVRWVLLLVTAAAAAATSRDMPQAQERGAAGGLRRLHQAPEAATSGASEGLPLSSLGSEPELPELTANLPSWMTPDFAMPLPSNAAVAAARGPRPLLMCLFVLALLGAAVAAWAGLRAWRRSCQRQRQRQQHRHDLESLLWAQQQQRQLARGDGYQPVGAAAEGGSPGGLKDDAELERSWGQGGSGGGKCGGSSSPAGAAAVHGRTAPSPLAATSSAAAAPAAAEGAAARAGPHHAASSERRTRLAALLAAHLGTRRTRSLGKLPPEALPAALTHQLASPEQGAAVQAKQRRRRRHRERRAAAAASDGKPKPSLQGAAAEQRRPPAPEELQLALQQQLLPPRPSGRQHGTAAARSARSVPPPPGTPLTASRGAAALSPPEAGPAAQRSTGGSSSSSGGASFWTSRSSGAAGGSGGAAPRASRSSSELAGSSSAVESVLEWLSSGDVCGESGFEQLEQPGQPGLHSQTVQQLGQQPEQPGLLAGLQFATSNSQGLQELGAGPHGVTYRGRLGGRHVAVKVLEPSPGFNPAALQPWAEALQAGSHPRILPLRTAAVKGGLLLLVSKLVHGGCLQAALQQPEQRRQLAWAARGREVALAAAEALCHLHDTLHMAHGNLTASNVLLDGSGRIFITDAGLSALLSNPPAAQDAQPTVQLAPAGHAALTGDVCRFGELLATMLALQPGAPPDCPAVVAALIQACRSPDPHQRPTAAHILRCIKQEAGRPAAWTAL